MDNVVLANIFGILGAAIWSIQLLPQIRLNYKLSSANNQSIRCFASWYLCGVFLGTYLVFQQSTVALIIQIILFSLFCFVLLFQIIHYQMKPSKSNMASYVGGAIVMTGVLIGFLYLIFSEQKKAARQGAFEILSCVVSTFLMTLGLIPQLLVVYRAKSGMGLSKIFICLDMLGGISAIVSLGFRQPFDYLAMITYIVVPAFQSIQLAMVIYYGDGSPAGQYTSMEDQVIATSNAAIGGNVAGSEIAMPIINCSGSIEEEDIDDNDHHVNMPAAIIPPPHPIDSLIASRAILQPLSLSKDFNEQVNIRAHPKIFSTILTGSSSYFAPAAATIPTAEFDHIVPESESDSEESHIKRSIILNQSSSTVLYQHLRQSTSNAAAGATN